MVALRKSPSSSLRLGFSVWVPTMMHTRVACDFVTCRLWQVKELYRLMKHDVADAKQSSYLDAWDLRRLYTFCFRRQLDTVKRGQMPRDRACRCGDVCILSFANHVLEALQT